MHRRRPFTSLDIWRPEIAERMSLRQQQARGPRPGSRPVRAAFQREQVSGAARPAPPTALHSQRGGRGSAPRRFGGSMKTGPTDTKFEVWIRPHMVTCFGGALSRGTRPTTCQSFWTASSVRAIWIQCELLRRACGPPFRKAKQALWNFPHSSGINCLLETPKNTEISFLLNFSDTNWGKGLLKGTKSWGVLMGFWADLWIKTWVYGYPYLYL